MSEKPNNEMVKTPSPSLAESWFLHETFCFHCDEKSLNDCDLTLKTSTSQVSELLNSQAPCPPVLRNL